MAENQTRGAGTIVKRKIEEFENRVLIEKSHCTIFKFDLSAAIIRGKHIALTDRQVGLSRFPLSFLVRERVAMSLSSKAHVALDETRERPGADLGERLEALVSAGDRGGAAKLFLSEAVQVPWPCWSRGVPSSQALG